MVHLKNIENMFFLKQGENKNFLSNLYVSEVQLIIMN